MTKLFSGFLLLACTAPAIAQQAPVAPAPAAEGGTVQPTENIPWKLVPFLATYDASYKGKHAGSATLRVAPLDNRQHWRLDLEIQAERGIASFLRLNIQQSTVFDASGSAHDQLRPLSQSTVRKAIFGDKEQTGSYDWNTNTAQWSGKVDKDRRAPIQLQPGDLSSLLLNLAIMRDAKAGATLTYRVVDNGRARQYQYAVATQTEIVSVGELSYAALRVQRINAGKREQIFWIANGVPTPVRMLQRDDGQDTIDLRLNDYQGVQ